MTIRMDYSNLNKKTLSHQNLAKLDYVQTRLLPEMAEYFGNLIKIRNVGGQPLLLKLGATIQCGNQDIQIPASHRHLGFRTDLMLYVRSNSTKNQTFVWTNPCVRDQSQRDRLVVAVLNLDLAKLQTRNQYHTYNFITLVHEVIHLLGFSNENLDHQAQRISVGPQQISSLVHDDPLFRLFRHYYNCSALAQIPFDQKTFHFPQTYFF